jgi:hypothetical protein
VAPRDRDAGRRWWTPPARVRAFVARHETLLWWAHSLYVLGLGALVMWLGARNYAWLRYSAFYLLFIWTSSLFLAEVVTRRDGPWSGRIRLAVNYVNKNCYQQLLFFILPIYAGSTTVRSWNLVFVVVLGISAVLSTLDIVYDRVLSPRRTLAASFFAFNVFAVVNLALPVLFGLSNQRALRVAAFAAMAGFVTLATRVSALARRMTWAGITVGGVLVFIVADATRPLVPPAPLRLSGTEFGTGLDARRLGITGPRTSLPAGGGGRIFVATAVRAPLGLRDRVELRWYRDGRLLWASSPHEIVGGRAQGFRLWSSVVLPSQSSPGELRVDVVTAAGQLIGRATIALIP